MKPSESHPDAAARLAALRLSDQLAHAHDTIASVKSWMEGQIRFRETHPQHRGLVEAMRVQIARCTETLESTVMKEHPIDPELKKIQDAVLAAMPVTDRYPHRTLAAEMVAKAKETPDDGPPRQQGMLVNFRGPAVGDIVLTELELPGMVGQRRSVTMPAIVAALNAEDPTLIGLDVFFPPDAGTPSNVGQIWSRHSAEPRLGHWRWPQSYLDLLARLAKLEAPRPAPGPQKPSVGRQVHYQSLDGFIVKPISATVTEVADDGAVVEIHILHSRTSEFVSRPPFSETPKPGHWSWPVFVK